MHWVDRGPEPEGLESIRTCCTPRWVDHYLEKIGEKPSDARWRDFHGDLRRAFAGLCAYCEERDKGVVDHFRPKSKFPALVYAWSNWLFACHNCNQAKGKRWPLSEYVDPCSDSPPERPENFFRFDTATGEILPAIGLSYDREDKAQKMIDDLSLNAGHHLTERLERLMLVSAAISDDPHQQGAEEENLRSRLISRDTSLSSITRAWLVERGYSVDG